MAVCIILISAGFFHYVPPEEVKKTIYYTGRDLLTPTGDIVIVYPSASNWNDLERFKLSSEGENYNVSYSWFYDAYISSYQTEIPRELYEYYLNKDHGRRDYQQYALSEYDREVVRHLANAFSELGRKYEYSDEEIALNVISFVHTIPFTYDLETTGYNEYPRYPVETLIDGGDCEDRAILAAAILYELDIDSALLLMPDHMALGLKDNGNFSGQSYLYNGTVYYYAGMFDGESTVGAISENITPKLLQIFPIVQQPVFSATLNQYMIGFTDDSYKYVLQGKIENTGPGSGENVLLRVVTKVNEGSYSAGSRSADSSSSGSHSSGDSSDSVPDQLIPIGSIPEDFEADIEVTITVPRASGICTVYVEGDNFGPSEVVGFYFHLR